jgi:uncharacterized protein
MAEFDISEFRARLRAAVREALGTKDAHAVAALRSLASAIDNAEAVEGPARHGVKLGVGAGDVERRRLSLSDVDRIVAGEIAEREAAAAQYERLGRLHEAHALRAEIALLEPFRAEL